MTRPPSGYTGPLDPARDPGQQMSDPVAQNLLADLVAYHEALLQKLAHDVELAGLGASEPASGRVSGSAEHDSMAVLAQAVKRAQQERDRVRKNALEELRRVRRYYEERLGLCPPRRPPVQSIDYLDGGRRMVG